MPFQNVSEGVAMLLETKYNPTLHRNQYTLVIHACLQQYFSVALYDVHVSLIH